MLKKVYEFIIMGKSLIIPCNKKESPNLATLSFLFKIGSSDL